MRFLVLLIVMFSFVGCNSDKDEFKEEFIDKINSKAFKPIIFGPEYECYFGQEYMIEIIYNNNLTFDEIREIRSRYLNSLNDCYNCGIVYPVINLFSSNFNENDDATGNTTFTVEDVWFIRIRYCPSEDGNIGNPNGDNTKDELDEEDLYWNEL